MPGQYSNFQGIRLVTLDASKSNLNILMEVGVIYRLTNVQNLAGRQGPIFWFPQYLPGLSVMALLASATGAGQVGLSFIQSQNVSDVTGNAAVVVAGNPTTAQATAQNISTSGFSACFFTVQSAGTLAFPITVQIMLNESQGTGAAAAPGSTSSTSTIQRKSGQVLTTTPLAANGTFTSAWFDSNATGDALVEATARADQNGANPPGFRIEGTDDTTNANLTVQLASFTSPNTSGVNANVTSQIMANVYTRFWRVVYVNGATLQGSFELTVDVSSIFSAALFPQAGNFMVPGQRTPNVGNFSGSSNAWALMTTPSIGAVADADAVSNANMVSGIGGSTSAPVNAAFQIFNHLFNGASWDRQRTPAIFKTVQATATGSTALWTPTAGKKFRLMKYCIMVTGNATLAAGAVLTVSLLDAAGQIGQQIDTFIPTATFSVAEDYISPWIDLGNGILSGAANNVLNVNLSAALTAGNVRVIACGTEE